MSARPRARRSGVRLAVGLLAVLPPAMQLLFMLTHDRGEWGQLFFDDAFYYFGVAQNLATGNGSTFSGLTETNGYHPLWLLVLTGIGVVVRDTYAFLVAVIVVQGVLWIGVLREGLRIGRRLGSEISALAGLAGLSLLAIVTGQLSFSGMESAPLVWLLLLAMRLGLELEDDGTTRGELRIGVVLALACLTRLDAVLTILPLACVLIVRDRPALTTAWRRSLALLGPTAAALAVYLLINELVFGTLTPVSGRAKAMGGPTFNTTPITSFLRAGHMAGQALWFGVVVLVLMFLAWRSAAWRDDSRYRLVMHFGVAFMVGQFLFLGYLVLGTSYPIWAWYFYDIALMAFCAVIVLAKWAGASGFSPLVRPVSLAGAVAMALATIPATFLSAFVHTDGAVAGAAFVDENLPADAVLAMGDRAGLFGYLADRPLLQIEGLVADPGWLDALESGRAIEQMRQEGVDYYVWYGPPGRRVTVDGEPCRQFDEPRNGKGPGFDVVVCDRDQVFSAWDGQDRLTIWRFRPELNRPERSAPSA